MSVVGIVVYTGYYYRDRIFNANIIIYEKRNMRCLIITKACKRCGGDLSLERDKYGVYAECIQCGYTWSKQDRRPSTIPEPGEHPEVKTTKL